MNDLQQMIKTLLGNGLYLILGMILGIQPSNQTHVH